MTQPFDLRLKGVPAPVEVKSARFTETFDNANDGFTASIICDRTNQPELYQAITAMQATPAQVSLNGQLKLTGKLTRTNPKKSATETVYDIAGWSNTFNFVDSELVPPYAIENKTIHSLAIIVGRQTNTKVNHTGPNLDKFDRVTVTPGMTGFQFIAPLAQQRDHVLSSTADGILLLQQADITQKPVGTIEEDSEFSLFQEEFKASFDYRRRFRTYKVVSRRPSGSGEATATDKNIKDPRHKLIFANDQIVGGLSAVAEYQLKQRIIEALTMQIPVFGWNAPDKKLWKSGTLITIISPTIFIPDGFTYFIRAVEFILTETKKMAVLSLIPKEVYTSLPVIEPWFPT
jgi:prophage tail gpP-like protein